MRASIQHFVSLSSKNCSKNANSSLQFKPRSYQTSSTFSLASGTNDFFSTLVFNNSCSENASQSIKTSYVNYFPPTLNSTNSTSLDFASFKNDINKGVRIINI